MRWFKNLDTSVKLLSAFGPAALGQVHRRATGERQGKGKVAAH